MTTKRPGADALSPTRLPAGRAPALSVIVPTRNEVGNIEPFLARLQDALASIDAEVLVVDDSDDATPELARQVAARSALPIRVHARPPGQRPGGLGGAVHVGFSEALAPVCVVMDADLQHPPELLETLLGVSRTAADFVIASRYVDGGVRRVAELGAHARRARQRPCRLIVRAADAASADGAGAGHEVTATTSAPGHVNTYSRL